jgi:hypothetical protein
MEETRSIIHTGLVRRNNFLRENPIRWRFVASIHWGPESVSVPAEIPAQQ